MNLVRLIKTYCKIFTDKHMSDAFPIQNGLKQGDALLSSIKH